MNQNVQHIMYCAAKKRLAGWHVVSAFIRQTRLPLAGVPVLGVPYS